MGWTRLLDMLSDWDVDCIIGCCVTEEIRGLGRYWT
jgi:hypothetical protein